MTVQLEKYKGSASRHTCPACGGRRTFTRYIDTETGQQIADQVGRCDRESNCGYHFKPGEYFEENRTNWTPKKKGIRLQGRRPENVSQANYTQRIAARKPDFIDKQHLIASLRSFEQNAFVQFLLNLFPFDPEDVWQAVSDYLIGTGPNGEAIFWQIDQRRRIRTGKLIAYDPTTGKRRKDITPNWIHSTMKRAGQLPDTFKLEQCFFGEHLLSKYPGLPIAICEAEKSAVIASICKAVFPDAIWLACGGKSNLNLERLERLGRGRRIILFPDADGFVKWHAIASDPSKHDLKVNVSDLIERKATEAEKANGSDLADYLIREQRKRNDPARREAFRELIEERLANMTIYGGQSEAVAEAAIIDSGFYAEAVRIVCQVCE